MNDRAIALKVATPPEWVETVLGNVDAFLQNHAHNERKVSRSALELAIHNPTHPELVTQMIDLSREELAHFKQVFDLLISRGQNLGYDAPAPYMASLRGLLRKPKTEEYLLDRLLVFAVLEARGCERFELLAAAFECECCSP